ncbi:ArsR family transcriptional regulator [Limnochorda pilosa]|uniref:ArsR family transcriptional regulator n=1 Tax=Limnochorda pilosa TaxID=1555112 RepID=A0A0K2SHS5_LIMPI|nr:ArsR family transcriptional regulator [Limnochorda pilosa]
MEERSPEAVRGAVVQTAKALSDPARVQMLELIAHGRACCNLPTEPDTPDGVCVCELQEQLGLGQSLVSYHVRVLKEAGLVREAHRGRWTYYLLDVSGLAALRAFTQELAPVESQGLIKQDPTF